MLYILYLLYLIIFLVPLPWWFIVLGLNTIDVSFRDEYSKVIILINLISWLMGSIVVKRYHDMTMANLIMEKAFNLDGGIHFQRYSQISAWCNLMECRQKWCLRGS